MPNRSLTDIDKDLSEAVKARAGATKSISQLSDAVVWNTRKIDELLAERSTAAIPNTPAELLAIKQVKPPPAAAPSATKKPPATPGTTWPGRQVK